MTCSYEECTLKKRNLCFTGNYEQCPVYQEEQRENELFKEAMGFEWKQWTEMTRGLVSRL